MFQRILRRSSSIDTTLRDDRRFMNPREVVELRKHCWLLSRKIQGFLGGTCVAQVSAAGSISTDLYWPGGGDNVYRAKEDEHPHAA